MRSFIGKHVYMYMVHGKMVFNRRFDDMFRRSNTVNITDEYQLNGNFERPPFSVLVTPHDKGEWAEYIT